MWSIFVALSIGSDVFEIDMKMTLQVQNWSSMRFFQNLLEARKNDFLVNLSQYTAVHRTWIIPPQIRNAIRGNWKLLWLKSLGTTALRSALIDYSFPSFCEPSTSFLEIIMVSKLFRSVYKMIIWYNLMVRHHLMMRACRGPRALIEWDFI